MQEGLKMKRTKVAFAYDFDETLSTTYMQDYFLIPELGMKPENFWKTPVTSARPIAVMMKSAHRFV